MRTRLEKLGIQLMIPTAHEPQSNKLAEGTNRPLLDKARSMLEYGGLTRRFWTELIKHAADLHNRTAMQPQNIKWRPDGGTSWYSNQLLQSTHIWMRAYSYTNKASCAAELVARADRYIYVGNKHGQHGLCLPITSAILTTKHVSFDKRSYPQTQEVSRGRERHTSSVTITDDRPEEVQEKQAMAQTTEARLSEQEYVDVNEDKSAQTD